MIIKPGGPAEIPAVLALLDRAAEWLVSLDRTGQWGTERQSTLPFRIKQSEQWATGGGLYLAWIDEEPVGVLVVDDLPPPAIPPAAEPELYVRLLITDRARKGEGIGARLLEHARELTRSQGRSLLRLDCYESEDRALVRYYESQGFTAADPLTFDLPRGRWTGRVLEQRV